MKKDITIIIADRNHHVREFLQRELSSEGYTVRMAENFRQIFKWAFLPNAVDLLVVDPNLPDADEPDVLIKLEGLTRRIVVVIHTFQSDFNGDHANLLGAAFIEKNGNSVEKLKQVIADLVKAPP